MSSFRIYNETLCPDLWDEYKHLDSQIRVNLLRMAYDFYEKTKLPAPLVDVYLMGSIANYNWTPDSDVDVHLMIDYNKLQMPAETAFKTVKTAGAQWNAEHNVIVKGHKVEMNFQNVGEVKPHVTGIYSLLKDSWIRQPQQMNVQIDRSVVQTQYNAMKAYIEAVLNSTDREVIKAAKNYIDAYRQYGLDHAGELSYENIVFKILRSKGLISKLRDAITCAYDKEMSLREITRKDIKARHPSPSAIKKGTPDLTLMTMDNLKAMMDKAARLLKIHGKNLRSGDLVQNILADYKRYRDELNKRFQYVNAPMINEGGGYDDATEDFFRRRDEQLLDLAHSLKQSEGRGRVRWNTVSASLLKRVWFQFGKYGRINENHLDKIADQILTNIARLDASTGMMGHTQIDVRQELSDSGIEFTDKEWNEWMGDYFTNAEGSWLLSDFGLNPLHKIYVLIFNADTPEEKLYACDKALNVVHQRNDLASLFVEGGSATLNAIASQGGYSGGYEYGSVNREFRNEGYGAGDPTTDPIATGRWRVKFGGRKTPSMEEDISMHDPSMRPSPLKKQPSKRISFAPKPSDNIVPHELKVFVEAVKRILDKKAKSVKFFTMDYMKELIADMIASEFSSPPTSGASYEKFINSMILYLAHDYDIRHNGRRIVAETK
jgi:hypothetical protein